MLKLFVFLLLLVIVSIPLTFAQTQSATLSGNAITTSYTSYSVNFGSAYSSIEQICWDSTFSGDLLDAGESIQRSIVPMPINYWYGFINLGSTPLSTLTSCITPAHTGYSEFLDGSVTGSIWMTNGTVTIQSLNIRLVNAVSTATTTTSTTTTTTTTTSTTTVTTTTTIQTTTTTAPAATTTTIGTTTTTAAGTCAQGAIPSSGCTCGRGGITGPIIETSGYCCWGSYSPTACATTIQPCTDSDGGQNYGVKGTGSGNYKGSVTRAYTNYEDYCATSTQLNEAYCGSDGYLSTIGYQCSAGCSNGACLSATTTTTTTTTPAGSGTCVNGPIPGNGACVCNGVSYNTGYCCNNVYSSSTPCSTNAPQCSEGVVPSSGCLCAGYAYTSGNCCFSKMANALVWAGNTPCTQTCPSMGGVCCYGAASDCVGTWNGQWAVDCQGYVCCIGTCKTATTTTTIATTTTSQSSGGGGGGGTTPTGYCTDTDGGINVVVKGTATDYNGSYTEYCDGNSVVEYFCDGNIARKGSAEGYPCAYYDSLACIDGRCVTSSETHYCTGGHDEDNDGLIDCNDPDCSSEYYCVRAVCGNGVCEANEYPGSCFTDCGRYCPQLPEPACAGGYIIKGDVDSQGCPGSPVCCGDGICNRLESSRSCSQDCGFEKPFCGDGKCNIGEDSFNCPSDCRGECPVSVRCPDGSERPCIKKDFGCICDTCPISEDILPPNCRQEINTRTGAVNVICEGGKICPVFPQLDILRNQCSSSGGKFVLAKDHGCEYPDCQFVEGPSGPFRGFDKCHTQDEIEAIKNKCVKLGLPAQIDVHDKCKVATCSRPSEQLCNRMTSNERQGIEDTCREQGLRPVKVFDESGCTRLECREAFECPKELPEEAYKKCQGIGGEMIVKKNENGCVRFADCLRPGDDRDARVDPIERVPDSAELLEIAFKLEELRIKLDTLAEQSDQVANYYQSINSPDAERWKRVADMFESAVSEVDKIKNDLRDKLDTATVDDLLEVRRSVRYISDVLLKDIAYVMLSTSEDVAKINEKKDCDKDEGCFERAFRRCQPVIFYPEGTAGPRVELTGLEGDTCILVASMQEPAVDMTCKIPNYAKGVRNPETDILPYCQGSMLEALKQRVPAKAPTVEVIE